MQLTAIAIVLMLLALIVTSVRASWVFSIAVGVLYAGGVVEQEVVFQSMTNSSVITLLLLMIASLALERSVLLPWLSGQIFHSSYRFTLLRLGTVTAVSSAFLNNTAVVATLMTGVLKNHDHPPSKLLLPLSYFSILGGTLTLIGTSTNLVINGLVEEQGLPAFELFSFLPVGGLLLLVCGGVVFIGTRWLPVTSNSQKNIEQYFLEAKVSPASRLVGRTVRQNGLRALDGLFLAEILRGKQLISPVTPDMRIEANDRLLFTGNVTEVKQLSRLHGVTLFGDSHGFPSQNLTEVIVSPESILVNRTLKQTDFRSRFDAAVVAIHRKGHALSGKLGEQILQAGDHLVLATGEDFHKRQNLARNFFLLNGKKVREPLTASQNVIALLGFFTAIASAAVSSLTLIDTLSAFVVLCLASDVIDTASIRRRFPFELWTILACALTIAHAFTASGLAELISAQLFGALGEHSVWWAFVGVFVATVLLTETMTNSAAAAIMFPIALAFAETYGVNYVPFVMAVVFAASASFISPYAYQTNLMVMNAGNYLFKDYLKAGWMVSLIYIVVALVTIPLFYAF